MRIAILFLDVNDYYGKTMVEASPERALRTREEDKLGRDGFIRRLTGALINSKSQQSTGVVIGITGPWGSGKSSILNMLHEEILEQHENALVVRFDPWLVSGRDDLIQQFLRELLGTINSKKHLKEKFEKLKKTLLGYGATLAPAADALLPGSGSALRIAKALGTSAPSLYEQRENLFSILSQIDLPIVVMVDELDRINDDEIRAVAQLVRAVGDFPNISYVLAYDGDKVAKALGNGEEAYGREYLEKIVQFPFPLPITLQVELKNLLEAELKALEHDVEFPKNWSEDERYKKLLGIMIPGILKTPRDIKRFTGTLHIMAGMVWGEVDWVDLLGFCALQTKAPKTVDALGEKYSRVIVNAGTGDDYLANFQDDKKSIEDRLSEFLAKEERTDALEKLLAFMFRFFSPDRPNFNVTDDSICMRRPFLTVMRKGLLPGALPRDHFMDFFKCTSDEMLKAFQEELEKGKVWDFLERMEEVYLSANLSDEAHRTLWKALGKFTTKPDTNWVDHYPIMRDIIRSMGNMFTAQFMDTETANVELAKQVFDDFVKNEDAHFPSIILRAHFLIYGLYGWKLDESKRPFLQKGTVKDVAERLTKQYHDALVDEEWLASIYSYEPLFIIQHLGFWDDACLMRMDGFMTDPLGLDAVGMIFFGGINTSDKENLSKYFDYEKFVGRVKARLAEVGTDDNKVHSSVVEALERSQGRW